MWLYCVDKHNLCYVFVVLANKSLNRREWRRCTTGPFRILRSLRRSCDENVTGQTKRMGGSQMIRITEDASEGIV